MRVYLKESILVGLEIKEWLFKVHNLRLYTCRYTIDKGHIEDASGVIFSSGALLLELCIYTEFELCADRARLERCSR